MNKMFNVVIFLFLLIGITNASLCTWTCNMANPSSNVSINQLETFLMTGYVGDIAGTCTWTGSATAQMSANNGSTYVTISTTTNLTTSDTNPQTEEIGFGWWTITGEDISMNNTPYRIRVKCIFSGAIKYSDYLNVTVAFPPPVLSFTSIVPANNSNISQQWLYINVTSNIPLTSANVTINSTVYALTSSNSTVWYNNLTYENVTSLSFFANGTSVYGASSGTEMRTVNFVNICGAITQNSTLSDNLYSTGTCIEIKANDITIDCAGKQIDFGLNYPTFCYDYAYGIKNVGYNRTTLKNCVIVGVSYDAECLDTGYSVYPLRGTYYYNTWNTTFINNSVKIYSEVFSPPPGTFQSIYVFDRAYNLIMTNNTAKGWNDYIQDNSFYGTNIFNSTFTNFSVLPIDIYNTCPVYGFVISGGNNITMNKSTLCTSGSYFLELYNTNNSLFESSIINYSVINTNSKNITFRNDSYIGISADSGSNVTIQWFARVNVTSGGSALTSTINDTQNTASKNGTFYGYYSLTPWFVANDTAIVGASYVSYNNHTIIVNNSGYTTNTTSFNWTGRDYTLNITLYLASTSSCTYGGSGNWVIQFADKCNITSSQYIYPNNLTFNGTLGYVTFGNPTGATLVMAVNRFFWNATGNVYMWFKNSTWFNGSMGG